MRSRLPTPPAAPLPGLWSRALALGVGVALALLLGEAAARGIEAGASPPLEGTRLPILRENPHGTGSYRQRANFEATVHVEGVPIRIRTNRHGMRWRDVAVEKPAGTRRVAFLGDSFAFGCWARDFDRGFVGVVDGLLARRGVEVLNFGVGGYGLADQSLQFREDVVPFRPDVVVVAMFVGNDLRDTYLGIGKETLVDGVVELDEALLDQRIPPRFLVKDDARPRPAEPRAWARALRHLALFRLGAPLLDLDSPFVTFEPNRRFTSFGFWSRSPTPEIVNDAVALYGEMLAALKDSASASGARLALVLVPTGDQVYALNPVGPRHDVGLPQRLLRQDAASRGVPCLDLMPGLRERAQRTGERLYLRTDSHLNERGHRWVGEAIASWLLREGLVSGKV